MYVHDDERQFQGHGKADGFRLQCDSWPGGGGHAEGSCVGGTEGRADAGDLILGLEGHHAESLVPAELVQDVRGWSNRVGAEEQRESRLLRGSNEAVGQCEVSGDVPIGARRHRRRLHLVLNAELFGCLTEGPACFERRNVGVHDLRLVCELLSQELDGPLRWPVVEPQQQAEGEHVLCSLGLLLGDVEILQCLNGHRGEGNGVDAVGLKRVVLKRACRIPDLLQISLAELVGVDDQIRSTWKVTDIRLESCRVHRHQDIRLVAGGGDVVIGERELEGRDPGESAGWRADLSWEVRQGQQVIAHPRCLGCESVAGQLHTVAGVPGEPDHDPVDLYDLLGHVTCFFVARVGQAHGHHILLFFVSHDHVGSRRARCD